MKEIWNNLSSRVKLGALAIIVITALYFANEKGLIKIPGLSSQASKDVAQYNGGDAAINNTDETAMLPVPNVNDLEHAEMDQPQTRLMNWVWFGNAGIFSANGGLLTVKGSLMEKNGVNLKMTTNNSVNDMKKEQLAFIADYASGKKNTTTGVHFVTLMGDGAGPYITAMNEQIKKAYGEEYCLKTVGAVGFSLGEDCLIGPARWKNDPQSAKGAIICAVIGDGDWALVVRWAASNGIRVNPDLTTYDPGAINFIPAPDDDFMKAAEEVLASRKVTLKEKDASGKLTGKTVEKLIEGAATWFPGDKKLVEQTDLVKVVSTKNYSNQMATVVVGCDKWMKDNSKTVTGFLSASLTAANQIKQYDKWFRYACELAPKVFCANADECSETADDWYKFARSGGYEIKNTAGDIVSVGGTQMANLADNKKYFGLKGGNNIYQTVFEYFAGVVKDLNPGGFMDNVKEFTSYDKAVDLSYLRAVNLDANDAGTTKAVDYSKNAGQVLAKKNWQIQFSTGSDDISPVSEKDLQSIYTELNIADENTKVHIVGHTDNVGNPDANQVLSESRARSVKRWLMNRSKGIFPSEKFNVDGRGQSEPVADNSSADGKAKNRRVTIELIQ